MLTCREFIEFLMEYLERALPVQRLSEFERHLGGCSSCRAYLQNYQSTVRLGRAAFADPEAGPDDALPEDVPEDLVKAILAARSAQS
jgi:anti-sigma factor RsiW